MTPEITNVRNIFIFSWMGLASPRFSPAKVVDLLKITSEQNFTTLVPNFPSHPVLTWSLDREMSMSQQERISFRIHMADAACRQTRYRSGFGSVNEAHDFWPEEVQSGDPHPQEKPIGYPTISQSYKIRVFVCRRVSHVFNVYIPEKY